MTKRLGSKRTAWPASLATGEAATLVAPRRFQVLAEITPEPCAGELRIRIDGCGVCASSLPAWQGRDWFEYPFLPGQLGHEGWGTIEAVGSGVSPRRVGDAVATWCDGGFSRYLCVDESDILPIPRGLVGRPLPLEPLGCAVNIVRRARVERAMPVAVVGIGFLGALLVQLLHAAGCEVHVLARRPFAQSLARALGARGVVPFDSPPEVVADLGPFPRVIEAVGRPESLERASALIDTGGSLIVAGYHQDGLRTVNLQEWNWKGIDVINAHERDPKVIQRGMRDALAALERGDIDLGPLLTHRYAPDQINQAFSDLEARPEGFLKGWIDFLHNL